MAATIEIDPEAETFVIGLPADRFIGRWDGAIDWNELIKDDFNAHNQIDIRYASAAYGQSWLLMHYLSLGPDQENALRLARYVEYLKNDISSSEAFLEAFGKTAAEMWEDELDEYINRMPYYTIRFRGLSLDTDFDISPAPPAELDPILSHLRMPLTSREAKRLKNLPGSAYDGWWARSRFNSHCEKPARVTFDPTAETFFFEWSQQDDEDEADTDLYSFEEHRGGSLLLTFLEGSDDEPDQLENLYLSLREGDIMCLTHVDDQPYQCGASFLRCPEPAAPEGS